MTQTRYFGTPPEKLKRCLIYEGWINSKHIEFENLRREYDTEGVPLCVENGREILIWPYDIDWWLGVWGELGTKGISPYEILTTSITLCKLFDILSVSKDINKQHLTLCVLKALHIGIIESDDITLEGDPIENRPSLSDDRSEEISLADPYKKPYIYIPQSAAKKFLTHEKWFEMRSDEEFFEIGGFDNTDYLADSILGEFNFKHDYRGNIGGCSRIKREAVARASVGLGAGVGLLDICSDVVATKDVGVLILKENWSAKADDNEAVSNAELRKIFDTGKYAVSPHIIDLFKYTNIIYQQDGERGYHLNLPTNNTGPVYKNVSHELYRSLSTYDDTDSPANHSDVDLYAVEQFVGSHVTVGRENDSNRNVVSVERFMTAFDQYAKLNDAELDDLDLTMYRDMRKGKLRSILEDNFEIERKSVRIDGDPTRVFHPVDLDQSVTELLNVVGKVGQETD